MRRTARLARCLWGAALLLASGSAGVAAREPTLESLKQMSISELENLDVTSVTKTSRTLGEAPAAIFVITHDQIRASGAATVPEILRLAPNLQVHQISASNYIITARGFSGNISDQNFSNQLLVLIDGRTVYTPLFSGVYWDMQDLVPEDIDRIEVISGPGAALWGANAVNGVINIITRKSSETQGGLVSGGGGNLQQSVSVRFGGRINEDLTWRAYVRDYFGDNTKTASGANAHDHWTKPQGGFRFDWTPSESDTLTVQGDAFEGSEAQAGTQDEDITGRNLLARWNHSWGDQSLQIQTYYDREGRGTAAASGNFWLDTYDLDFQHSFPLNSWNAITWGGGTRLTWYRINGTASLFFIPASHTLSLSNAFVQDEMAISESWDAVLGMKIELDPYSGVAPMPNLRVSYKADDKTLFWAAVSRAVRSPTPFDRDVQEKLGPTLFLTGNPNFESVKLWALEAGMRMQPVPDMSFSVSAFYNFYDDIRSIEPGPSFIPLYWGNGLAGDTFGFEAWGNYQVAPWWQARASFEKLFEQFHFDPSASGLLGTSQIADDPGERASLGSTFALAPDVSLDAELRYQSALSNPHLPAYIELNASVGWNVSDDVRLSLSGFNLLHARHLEFPASEANAVPRSFSAGLSWRL